MKNHKSQIAFAIIILCTWFLTGCMTTSHYQLSNANVLNYALSKPYELRCMMINGNEYALEITHHDSSKVEGNGKTRKNTDSDWQPYKGSIPVDSIQYVEFKGQSFGKTVMIIGSAATLALLLAEASGGPDSPELTPNIIYTGPEGSVTSCPFIYSWDGMKYRLQAEAFGVAFGKALEMNTCSRLPALQPDNGVLKIRISNERLETHYINSVRLLAYQTEINDNIILDPQNSAWPVKQADPPIAAVDQFGRNVLTGLQNEDGSYWQSELESATISNEFTDEIYLKFHRPRNLEEGNLVITAINTELSVQAFRVMFDFLGDQAVKFVHESETDLRMIAALRNWIEESSLKVDVKQEGKWEKAGTILPEANAVPFSRAVHLKLPEGMPETVEIRLSSLSDVWKIDDAGIAWSAAKPLTPQVIAPLSAVGPGKTDLLGKIRTTDDQYAMILPPQQIDLTFALPAAAPRKKLAYALDVRGYLYEWIPETTSKTTVRLADFIPDSQRLDYLKYLLNNKNLLLPPIYKKWESAKQDRISNYKN